MCGSITSKIKNRNFVAAMCFENHATKMAPIANDEWDQYAVRTTNQAILGVDHILWSKTHLHPLQLSFGK